MAASELSKKVDAHIRMWHPYEEAIKQQEMDKTE